MAGRSPRALVEPTTWPRRKPPPAIMTDMAWPQWSRPGIGMPGWPVLRFNAGHAFGFAVVFGLVMMLLVLPLLFGMGRKAG